jgi:hypothetical protein
MKQITTEMAIDVPEYVGNKDVYAALDNAARLLDTEGHMTVTDMVVYGLDPQLPAAEEGAAA